MEKELIGKVLLWGAGTIGSRFIRHIDRDKVIAYIDSSIQKIGGKLSGKPIISFEEYLQKYSDYYVVITGYYYQEIIDKMKANGIYRFFWCMDCPGEWTDECERPEFEHHVDNKILYAKKPAIYGCNYYSFCLAERIFNKTGVLPAMIYNASCDAGFINQVKRDMVELDIKKWDEVEDGSVVYVTEDRRIGFDEEIVKADSEIVECWDCASEIESYHNPKLKQFKNLHDGERCFIVGLGPSLRTEDLEMLHERHEICFSMNEIYKAFGKIKWRPDYFVVSDTNGIIDSKEMYAKIPAKYIFVSDQLGKAYDTYFEQAAGARYMRYHIHRATSMKLTPRFSEKVSNYFYYGYTVTYIILQLAVYMGFNEIILLGIDATGSKRGYGPVEYTHFYDNGNMHPEKMTEPYNTNAYIAAGEYVNRHGIRILNATRGGELEVFDRIGFDELFD